MANIYKNAFYDPSVTTAVTVYTTPSDSRAIVQNIQLTNDICRAPASYQIAYASISGPTICNVAKGPVVLEEGDALTIETSVTTGISAIVSILEINRS